MSHPLHDTFASLLRAAQSSEPALDPAPVLHALSYVILLEAIGARGEVARADVQSLVSLGEAALARAKLLGGGTLPEEHAEFLELARPLAEAGLALLRGEAVDFERLPSDLLSPSPARLLAALRGALTGVEAGRLAARFLDREEPLLRDAHRMRESMRAVDEPALRLAAAPAEEIRDPREGTRVLYDEGSGVEVVLFDDAFVAAYGEADVVTLEGRELQPVLNRAGYALAKITAPPGAAVKGVVKVGDGSEVGFELPQR